MKRSLHLTAERLTRYSRRGNYHSDPRAAAEIGYTKLVAQGMQVAAPAYGILLDAWGDRLLAGSVVEWKFVGMVVEGETVEADVPDDAADRKETDFTVDCGDRVAVVGTARR